MFDDIEYEIATGEQLHYSMASPIDHRSLRSIQIFMAECVRFNIVHHSTIALNVQLFHQEPAFRHLMDALITLSHADYEPPSLDSKEFVYSSLLGAIKRMRLEPNDIDDEALVKCRSMLALIETSRVHGGNDFMSIWQAVNGLFDAWMQEMAVVTPATARRRHMLMKQYGAILKSSQTHFHAVKSVKSVSQPHRVERPNFQRNFFDFLAGVEITAFMSESYGFSISEPTNKPALEQRLKAWYNAFEYATAQPELMDIEDVLQARHLLAHYLRCKIIIDACARDTETRYARHNSDFASILDCMERVIVTDYWQDELMWLGAVSPLFFTAVHCRKRVCRYRALALLRKYNIEERSWNSRIAYLIASAVAAVESRESSTTTETDAAFVRLLKAEYNHSTNTIKITYRDMRTKAQVERAYEMLVLGSQDINICRELRVWPLVVEVRTHGAAFSRCPLGGPLEVFDEYDEHDYLKWLKKSLKPRPMRL